MPEELQKEYEEFLAWKKWNEERAKKNNMGYKKEAEIFSSFFLF